jgi:ribosomal protein L11 methyltransferase
MLGYEGFLEREEGIEAFISLPDANEASLHAILKKYGIAADRLRSEVLEDRNWNEEWEKSFNPITVGDQVFVRANFHPSDKRFPIEIVIDPKQSFGTGHHETTTMMMEAQLDIQHRNKRVLDVGTGTGILAILASRLGARVVVGTDIDPKCMESSSENFVQNGVKNCELRTGSIQKLTFDEEFDLILANINLNVLKAEIGDYAKLLSLDGYLLLSGFYSSDSKEITSIANNFHLKLKRQYSRNNWVCMVFSRVK